MKRYFALFLSLVLAVGLCPVFDLATEAGNNTVYRIFVADPSKQGDAGTDVTAVSDNIKSHAAVKTDYNEEDGFFYRSVYTYDNKESLWNRTSYFKSDKSNNTSGFSWIGEEEALNALGGYATVSYKVRMNQQVEQGNKDSDNKIQLFFGTATTYGAATQFEKTDVKNSDTWKEFTDTPAKWAKFYSGYFCFKAELYPNFVGTLTIDFKDIVITVKESDRAEIDAALKAAGSSYTFNKLISNYYYVETVEENNTDYSIFTADPDRVAENSGDDVTAGMNSDASYKPAFKTVKMTEDNSFYRTVMSVNGKGGDGQNTVVQTGLSVNTRGYGWLEDDTVLKTIRPYLKLCFDYRVNAVSGTVPSDGKIYINTATAWTGRATSLGSVEMSGVTAWKSVELTLTGNDFGSWYSGLLSWSVYSNSGKFDGKYNIDFANITFKLNTADREAINTALANAGSLWKFDDIVQSDVNYNSHNVIWYASPERANAAVGDNVTGECSNGAKFETVVANDRGVDFYRTVMNVEGSGGDGCNAIIKSGISSDMNGYGWLSNKDLLNALRPYMYISFDYRFTGTATIPSDANIYFGAASSKGKAASFGSVKGASNEWKTCALSLCSGDFSDSWDRGYFTFNIYSYSKGFSGEQTIDLRNIRIELRDCDRLALNAALSKVKGINSVSGFTSNVSKDRDETGNYSYYNVLINALPNIEFDANDDDLFDIRDIVRMKKITAKMIWSSNVIKQRLDTDGTGGVNATVLKEARIDLLMKKSSPYANDVLKVGLVTEHPGVADMDAKYTLSVKDKNGLSIGAETVNVTVNNEAVTVSGYELTVPYAVREADNTLTVTVTDKNDGTVFGRYDFDFIKFTSQPTFNDDFDTVNTAVWSEFSKSGTYKAENGELVFTSEVGQTVGLTTKGKFEQAYGSFSARIKMPEKALVNGAFWLYSNQGKVYKRNALNPSLSGGEIDIVEYFPTWNGGKNWSTTVHYYGSTPGHHRYSGVDNLNAGVDLGNDFHIYSAVWTSDAIYSYLDGDLYRVYDGEGLSDHSDGMQMILSLHGNSEDSSWGGKFNADDYPDSMKIDWVRVYGLAE